MLRVKFLTFVLLLLTSNFLSAQIIIDDFTDATNDRFTNDPTFIGAGRDFSGVGRGDGLIDTDTGLEVTTQVRWGTLLSRNVVITANHFPAGPVNPNQTNSISFYRNNDSSDSVVRNLVSGQRLGNSDLFLSVLDAPVPADFQVYDFARGSISADPFDEDTNNTLQPAVTDDGLSLEGEIAYLFGVSPTVRPDADTRFDQAVGQNRISGYLEDIAVNGPDNDLLVLIRDARSDPNYVTHEARFVAGDSGAPLFIDVGGELQLLGTNSVVSTAGTVFSGIAYIGNHAAEIDAFIAANAIPEPASGTLIGILSCVVLMRRKRN